MNYVYSLRVDDNGQTDKRMARKAEEEAQAAVDELCGYARECIAGAFDDLGNALAREHYRAGHPLPVEHANAVEHLYCRIASDASECLARFRQHARSRVLATSQPDPDPGVSTSSSFMNLPDPSHSHPDEEAQLDSQLARLRSELARARSRYFSAESRARSVRSVSESLSSCVDTLASACPLPPDRSDSSHAHTVESALSACNRIERLISRAELADASLSEQPLDQQQQQHEGLI